MIEELQVEREKLNRKYTLLEHMGGISAVITLIALGAILGSLPNSDKKYLKISTAVFVLSEISLITSCRWSVRVENQLEINSHNIDKARSPKPDCYDCIYLTGNNLLPCAVHPTVQQSDCPDKTMRG